MNAPGGMRKHPAGGVGFWENMRQIRIYFTNISPSHFSDYP